ncbi:hypothetical protein RBSWK_01349 [Rhodopirellula baltica SWK14]|uniref:Uncharacterized protein n=1 Tax=Rhodopirellula baltica SWK14 TaxID=993516 RepID=L7CMI0_RHOBT|nr:hypothetical protein RBSWK_01349 [Rhodopirellula baltica SWK14]
MPHLLSDTHSSLVAKPFRRSPRLSAGATTLAKTVQMRKASCQPSQRLHHSA